jgi:hypothetical protein
VFTLRIRDLLNDFPVSGHTRKITAFALSRMLKKP